jgi:hypothetical protein
MNSLLGRLVGFRLYSVEFVMDYVQLRFDGPTDDMPVLTCDVLPSVVLNDRKLTPAEPGWADAVRGLIMQDVTATHEQATTGITVEFGTGLIQLHPAEIEVDGPEIAMLNGFVDRSWMVWRPGEEAFEDLST